MSHFSREREVQQALPPLRPWEVSLTRGTLPPKQFVRDGYLQYTWKRLVYDLYTGRVHLDHRKSTSTVDEVLLFGRPMRRGSPLEPLDALDTVAVDRLNLIDEAFFQTVKASDSEPVWEGFVFRVGVGWYSDYTTHRNGGTSLAFATAQEAANDLNERTRSFLPDMAETERKEIKRLLEAEHVAEETRRMREEAEAVDERRCAEDERRRAEEAEIAILEQQLADIERTQRLNELRAKVAQARESGDA